MELRKIITDENKSLREISKEVSFPLSNKHLETAKYLLDYLIFADNEENQKQYNITPGVGLAAPQIGENLRMFAVSVPHFKDGVEIEGFQDTFINPKIISKSMQKAYLSSGEGCLSVKKPHEGYVPRYAFLTFKAYSLKEGKEIEKKIRGLDAIVFQHEYDHLDGILFYDRINRKEPFKKPDNALEI